MITLEQFVNNYEIFTAIYSLSYVAMYIFLAVMSYRALKNYYNSKNYLHKDVLVKSNHSEGVSLIAPAFNEGVTIVYNVKSLLSQEYPKFEVIIINDGSTDDTLEKLITEFELVKVDFFYQEKIITQPVRAHYKSTNSIYSKLLVVDKVNGGCKADGSNAGINSAKYDIFICTDVDCILRKDTISTLVKPFLETTTKVIAAGATIRISNACFFKDGMLEQSHYPKNFFARFQELEYIRSFVFGRMAWSNLNGLLLVSGGLGIFHKDTAIEAGGYWHKSLGEDLDLVIRMRRLMHERKEKFEIKYVPETLCWTEVPSTKKVFLSQRKRWARGLIQTLNLNKKLMFNPKYGVTGMLAYPYFVLFELLVPIVEVLGLIVLLLDYFYFSINYDFLIIVSVFVYLFYISISLISVFFDQYLYKQYANTKELLTLILMIFIEPFVYHPINVYASIIGYYQFFANRKQKWGRMVRKGFKTVN